MADARCVVVTGGDSGIGAACAVAFGSGGDRVAILFHSHRDRAEQTAARVREAGAEAMIVQCSVEDEASVADAFDAVEAEWGPAAVLVNSAGLNMAGIEVRDMPLDHWRAMIGSDLTGAFLVSRRFLLGRAPALGGVIVHISSIHAFAVRAGGADYVAAKAGLSRFVQNLAVEEAPRGVRVNAVEPGMILTPMNQQAVDDPGTRARAEANIPMKRAGTPDEVAALVRFLASDAASYITGARIVIDGGLSLIQAIGA